MLLTHEARWICRISSNLAINFNQPLFNNLLYFIRSERVLQTVSEKQNEGETFPPLVWSSAGSGSLDINQTFVSIDEKIKCAYNSNSTYIREQTENLH